MSLYQHYLFKPMYNSQHDFTYYSECLEYWLPNNELDEIDLSQCSQPGDIIDKNNEERLLWYYNPSSKLLFIPTKNAVKILLYKYHTDITKRKIDPEQNFMPQEEHARQWLRCLGFCGAYVESGTKSIYAGVKGAEGYKMPSKIQHCSVFDMSISEEEREDLRPTEAEIKAMKSHDSPLYALPANWLIRRQENISIDPLAGAYPARPPQLLTSKQNFARQQQIKRLRQQFGDATPEFHHNLALYDKGLRRARATGATTFSSDQLAKRIHTRLIELLQDIGGVHHDTTNEDPAPPSVTRTKTEFYSQRGFGALSHTFNTSKRLCLPGTQYPIAFVWDARRVNVTDSAAPLLEIISVAVSAAWLKHPQHLPNYDRACSYDGLRDIPLAMQDRYGFHKVAVFTNPEYKAARTQRATRKHRRKDQRMAEMEAQIARLTQLLEKQNA